MHILTRRQDNLRGVSQSYDTCRVTDYREGIFFKVYFLCLISLGGSMELVNGLRTTQITEEKSRRKVTIAKSATNMELLRDGEVEDGYRTVFIRSGYRRPGLSIQQCLYSLTRPSNETINVWSHAIAFGLFLVRFYRLFFAQDQKPFASPWGYPLLCFAAGILALMAMSAIAHLINCISITAHHTGFYLDYAAICVYSFSASLTFYFYSRPGNSSFLFLKSPEIFLAVSALICCVSVAVTCSSRHRWKKTGHVVRTTLFTMYFVIVTLPFTYRLATSNEEHSDSHHYFARLIAHYIISALVNVTKLPERAFPYSFDFFGQSHHFLHVFAAFAASDAFNAVYVDMVERQKTLAHEAQPDFYNTIGIFSVVVVINLLIVLWFVRSLIQQEKQKKQ